MDIKIWNQNKGITFSFERTQLKIFGHLLGRAIYRLSNKIFGKE